MRSGLLALLLVLVVTTWAAAKPAPLFTIKALDGRTVSLVALKGKAVVLLFWAPW